MVRRNLRSPWQIPLHAAWSRNGPFASPRWDAKSIEKDSGQAHEVDSPLFYNQYLNRPQLPLLPSLDKVRLALS